MQKFLLSFFALFLVLTPVAVNAKLDIGQARVKSAAGTAGYDDKANETSFAELIGTIIKGVLSFVGVIFMVLMVYAGFLWMTAQGEDAKIEKAQGIIKSSVIGLVVMLGAYSITSFVVPMILDKTAGGNGGGGGGAGGDETVLCCTICPAHPDANNNTCESLIVSTEAECMEKPGCDDSSGNNVDKNCSVTPSPAKQCGGPPLKLLNCCTLTTKKHTEIHENGAIDYPASVEKFQDITEDECDAKVPPRYNSDYDTNYDEGILESQCQ